MKSLLNRRSVLAGPSHLVQVARENAADSVSPDDSEEAALAAAAGVTPAVAPADAPSAPVAEPARPVTTLRPVPVVPSQVSARGVQMADTAEIEWLAEEEALTPFRVFRSFAYSVSLLFHAKELAYYVALYQDGSLWRALKAAELEAAEAAFHHFEEQATRLSEGETRRAQLEAQNEQLARMIARSEAQAERLRTDLQRRGAQEQTVSNRQHQVRKEVSQLEAQRVAAQAHLNKAHRQIHQLNLTSNEGIPHLPTR
ncbi:DUF2968 domain-containing protein [Paraburkholderia nemoris]|uniref:DUF2968 domain-containing protein n=1 Tax=Paraburkholderia nemoris TaxID=2793076 RepID=A0ABM8R4T9_9BURK|nr:DUF2968 domain-containing protein [Paraburkholderia nemoris]KPD15405.1 hypothetical protein ADM96_33165 [Burkholderia sp. ST111]MBK3784524.1 DUF2968 domain-containing protein [Paraburkholderia aspalathi]MBK5149144.1 DUF2968 domain-containing protein [Burkholderia sp. R-69608]MBK3810504.1 DUF2968 domain-containing protein [Paraburkholderia aspalathi]CAE6696124.1 hypothetical protein R75777_00477 [Paraburkholderia nemoris]